MPPAAIPSRVVRTIASASSRPVRSRSSRFDAGGNLGARPKPPCSGSNCARSAETAFTTSSDVSGSLDGARSLASRIAPTSASACSSSSRAPLLVGLRHGQKELREARHVEARLRREVRASVERPPVRREEDGHRPAAVAGHGDDRLHVEPVHVRALLPVDLHRDEALVHELRRLLVLEGLVLHDVAPVAGRVADREQDRLVLRAGALERVIPPRVPVDGVVGVLEEVGAGLLGEPVGH